MPYQMIQYDNPNFNSQKDNRIPLIIARSAQHLREPFFSQSETKDRFREVSGNIRKFDDTELSSKLSESVRGQQVVILCSFRAIPGVASINDLIMEVGMYCNAAHGAGAEKIILIAPYFPYMRQDKKHESRSSAFIRTMIDIFKAFHVDQIITLDLHAEASETAFDPNPIHLKTPVAKIFANFVNAHPSFRENSNIIIASPDKGGYPRAANFAKILGFPQERVITGVKDRNLADGEIHHAHFNGDFEDALVLVIDDIISTGTTIVSFTDILRAKGVRDIWVFATHGVLPDKAYEILPSAKISQLVTTNGNNYDPIISDNFEHCIIDLSSLLAQSALLYVNGGSISRDLVLPTFEFTS